MGDYHEFRASIPSRSTSGSGKFSVLRGTGRKSYKSASKLLREVDDMTLVDRNSRAALLGHLITKLKSKICAEIQTMAVEYAEASQKRKEGHWEQ